MRDGRPYLKSFIEHYFSLGVKHIFFLDNGSTDGTVAAAQSYENVTVLQTDLPFKEHKFFLKRYLITRFGRGRWVLYVDIDELFDYPYSDVVSLDALLRYLTERSYTAVVGQMLDMFPEEPLTRAERGEDEPEDEPLKELHRFYDISNVRVQGYYPVAGASNTLASDQIEVYRGGIRRTLFGHPSLLTKHPLMFIDNEIRPMNESSHWVGGARVADITCVLFHYHFLDRFYERTLRAVAEENYAFNSAKYKKYLEVLEQDPELWLKKETAQELGGVSDLVDNQFLVVSGDYVAWIDAEERKKGTSDDSASLEHGEPRRLIEAFSKVSARARAQAARIRQLEYLERLNLQERNQNLERQIREIQSSRIWKLLSKLGRARAGMLGKKG
jgi:glycosyltransferase involved in cell wall biosynthesis